MPNFLHDFWRRILSCYILLNDQIALSSCLWEEKELPFKNQFFTRIQTSQLTCFPPVLENLMTDCHKVWELVVNGLTYSSKGWSISTQKNGYAQNLHASWLKKRLRVVNLFMNSREKSLQIRCKEESPNKKRS